VLVVAVLEGLSAAETVMLYDKRWDVADPIRDAFAAWLCSREADQHYTYQSFSNCACAQYCRQTRKLWQWFWCYGARADHEWQIWHRYDPIAGIHPHTFGALLQRVLSFSQR
jgi:hypothetical protein